MSAESVSIGDLHEQTLDDNEVVRVMVSKSGIGPRAGMPLLTGYESDATHETIESALEFIDSLYESPEAALDDMDLEDPDNFTIKPRIDTVDE